MAGTTGSTGGKGGGGSRIKNSTRANERSKYTGAWHPGMDTPF